MCTSQIKPANVSLGSVVIAPDTASPTGHTSVWARSYASAPARVLNA